MTKDWSIIDASDSCVLILSETFSVSHKHSKDVVAQVCKEDSGLKGLADYSRNKISWYKAKRIGPDDLEDIAEATTDKFEKKQLKQVAYVRLYLFLTPPANSFRSGLRGISEEAR